MKKILDSRSVIDDDSFPFSSSFSNDRSVLESFLYSPFDPGIENGKCAVYDFEGITKWFASWSKNDELYKNGNVHEYISENIGRTIDPVRIKGEE